MTIEAVRHGRYYHIYNRGNNRENLFVERRNYPYFLRLFVKHILPVAETFAYCLLPNHFHFAIRTRTEEEQAVYWREELYPFSEKRQLFRPTPPSLAFKNMFIAYTQALNRATGRTGMLFERPFHRKPVNSLAQLLNLITYIHLNPQKHGLVDDFRDWKWSSYSAYASDQPTHLQREQVVAWYGNRHSFFEAHAADLTNLEDLSNRWEP